MKEIRIEKETLIELEREDIILEAGDLITITERVDARQVLRGYLNAALWSSTDDDLDPFDYNYSVDDFSRDAVRQAEKDINEFIKRSGSLLDDIDEDSIGHDFWLTRNGHGAGFWDRGLGEVGDKLTDIAGSFRELYLWANNGKVEME